MHAYLRHLQAEGIDGAPRALDIDDEGREVLTYIEGEVLAVPNWQPGGCAARATQGQGAPRVPTIRGWAATRQRLRERDSACRDPACPSDQQIPRLLAFTHDEDPKVRRLALKHLCPCRLLRQRDVVWARVFELTEDPDPGVRRDAVHAMTDGSPGKYAERVRPLLEAMRRDPDPHVRKYVGRTLDAIPGTGRINVN